MNNTNSDPSTKEKTPNKSTRTRLMVGGAVLTLAGAAAGAAFLNSSQAGKHDITKNTVIAPPHPKANNPSHTTTTEQAPSSNGNPTNAPNTVNNAPVTNNNSANKGPTETQPQPANSGNGVVLGPPETYAPTTEPTDPARLGAPDEVTTTTLTTPNTTTTTNPPESTTTTSPNTTTTVNTIPPVPGS